MKKYFLLSALFIQWTINRAQPTMGLIMNSPSATDGYTLFAPLGSHTTYLIDNCGHEVHQWLSNYSPGNSVYFLEDGSLLRSGNSLNSFFPAGGEGGIIERYDWNNNLLWSYSYSDSAHCLHHDIHQMPNGHILAIAWELKTHVQAVAAGRTPNNVALKMWTEEIIEIDPLTNTIVWEWHVWDHNIQDFDSTKNNFGIVSDYPERVDLNYSQNTPDVYHMNGIDYNPVLDQIMVSVHQYNEIWIIDHATTSSEAASHNGGKYGHGGDLLYRWGNPQAYQMGTVSDRKFWGQHNPSWIPDSLRYGKCILVFNNGLGITSPYSSVDIIQPPVDSMGYYQHNVGQPFGPPAAAWSYSAIPQSSFYSSYISGVQPMPQGHYLICEGDNGVLFEIDSLSNTVWKYINPVSTSQQIQGNVPINNSVFRCSRLPSSFPGFNGQSLTTGNLIEQNPLPDTCSFFTGITSEDEKYLIQIFPNPVVKELKIKCEVLKTECVSIFNMLGEKIYYGTLSSNLTTIDCEHFSSGIYFLKIASDKNTFIKKFVMQ